MGLICVPNHYLLFGPTKNILPRFETAAQEEKSVGVIMYSLSDTNPHPTTPRRTATIRRKTAYR